MIRARLSPIFLTLLVLTPFLFSSCGNTVQSRAVFRMGEKMQVGPLIYNVMETKWTPQLGDILHSRVPKQRYLLIRMSVTNAGGKEAAVPFLTLEDNQGGTFQEEQSGEGVDGWLGFLRSIRPAETETGWIVFDVAPNSYNLRISANTDGGEEQSLLIQIPFSIDSMNDAMPVPK
jgi:hypothetical protein